MCYIFIFDIATFTDFCLYFVEVELLVISTDYFHTFFRAVFSVAKVNSPIIEEIQYYLHKSSTFTYLTNFYELHTILVITNLY